MLLVRVGDGPVAGSVRAGVGVRTSSGSVLLTSKLSGALRGSDGSADDAGAADGRQLETP
jgi:hypothetical protein